MCKLNKSAYAERLEARYTSASEHIEWLTPLPAGEGVSRGVGESRARMKDECGMMNEERLERLIWSLLGGDESARIADIWKAREDG